MIGLAALPFCFPLKTIKRRGRISAFCGRVALKPALLGFFFDVRTDLVEPTPGPSTGGQLRDSGAGGGPLAELFPNGGS